MNATTHSDKTASSVRPAYIHLGTDGVGRHHCYDTATETVHVVHPDGTRPYRIDLAADAHLQSPEHYVAEVGERVDWRALKFGRDAFLARLAEAV